MAAPTIFPPPIFPGYKPIKNFPVKKKNMDFCRGNRLRTLCRTVPTFQQLAAFEAEIFSKWLLNEYWKVIVVSDYDE